MSIMLKSTNSTNTIDKTERVLAHPLRTVDYRFFNKLFKATQETHSYNMTKSHSKTLFSRYNPGQTDKQSNDGVYSQKSYKCNDNVRAKQNVFL